MNNIEYNEQNETPSRVGRIIIFVPRNDSEIKIERGQEYTVYAIDEAMPITILEILSVNMKPNGYFFKILFEPKNDAYLQGEGIYTIGRIL